MGAGSGLDRMWSNILPKPSSSEFSSARSESTSRGGVAVLVELVVTVLFLRLSTTGGRPPVGGAEEPPLSWSASKENDLFLPGVRKIPKRVGGAGGVGMSSEGFVPAPCTFLSDRVSIEEGFVEEVLRRVEDAALSLGLVE